MTSTTPRSDTDSYADLERLSSAPLWRHYGDLFPAEPTNRASAHLWRGGHRSCPRGLLWFAKCEIVVRLVSRFLAECSELFRAIAQTWHVESDQIQKLQLHGRANED